MLLLPFSVQRYHPLHPRIACTAKAALLWSCLQFVDFHPCGYGLVGEQPLAVNDACRVLGEQGRQRTVGEVKPQQLAPEVHRRADRPGRHAVGYWLRNTA